MKQDSMNQWPSVAGVFLAVAAATIMHSATVRAVEPTYQLAGNWAQLPAGTKWQTMTTVDIDAKGTVYVFQRGEPSKIMAFDTSGKLVKSWGDNMFPSAHGLRVDGEKTTSGSLTENCTRSSSSILREKFCWSLARKAWPATTPPPTPSMVRAT